MIQEPLHHPIHTAPCTTPPGLRIGTSPGRGRGVFAAQAFAAGDPIERAPALVVPLHHAALLRDTLLDDYWFFWDDSHRAIALGCGSLYNHACPANVRFACDPATRTILFTAARPIAPGEELLVNYHGTPEDSTPVWFPTSPALDH